MEAGKTNFIPKVTRDFSFQESMNLNEMSLYFYLVLGDSRSWESTKRGKLFNRYSFKGGGGGGEGGEG